MKRLLLCVMVCVILSGCHFNCYDPSNAWNPYSFGSTMEMRKEKVTFGPNSKNLHTCSKADFQLIAARGYHRAKAVNFDWENNKNLTIPEFIALYGKHPFYLAFAQDADVNKDRFLSHTEVKSTLKKRKKYKSEQQKIIAGL